MSAIPEFLDQPNVLGIGEIGLNKNSKNELSVLEAHLALAKARDTLVLVHTPHLEDKYKGTMLIMDAVSNAGLDADRVLIDHVDEHTVGAVLYLSLIHIRRCRRIATSRHYTYPDQQ